MLLMVQVGKVQLRGRGSGAGQFPTGRREETLIDLENSSINGVA